MMTEDEQPPDSRDVPKNHKSCQTESCQLEDEKESDVCKLQAEVGQIQSQLDEQLRINSQIQQEHSATVMELRKLLTAATKDKEAMVMKYAINEKEILSQKRLKDEAERKHKQAEKDRDEALSKVKQLNADKVRLQQIADSRYQDVQTLKKDVDKWKEEARVQEAKASLAASRMKTEMDHHMATQQNLDAAIKQLTEVRLEVDKTRLECDDFMRRMKDDHNEHRVKLIIDQAAAAELVSLKDKYKLAMDENQTMNAKIQTLTSDLKQKQDSLILSQGEVGNLKSKIDQLTQQVTELDGLTKRVECEEKKNHDWAMEVDNLKKEAVQLHDDMKSCRLKEAELLTFTQKLTDRNVALQSELATAQAKLSHLESTLSVHQAQIDELKSAKYLLEKDYKEERNTRKCETEMLAKKLAESSRQNEALKQQLLDSQNEVLVLNRKHKASIRELSRELNSLQKRLDSTTRLSPSQCCTLSASSRTSSNLSLHKIASADESTLDPSCSADALSRHSNGLNTEANNYYSSTSSQEVHIPDTSVLVEKIVKLQQVLAKKQEKLDFLEEHVATLLAELKKKKKLINHIVLQQENVDEPEPRDPNRRKSSSDVGGLMASVYSNSKLTDSEMTLPLSLEINQKFQAMLEDVIMENFTLKDSISTLGKEIACLAAAGKGGSASSVNHESKSGAGQRT